MITLVKNQEDPFSFSGLRTGRYLLHFSYRETSVCLPDIPVSGKLLVEFNDVEGPRYNAADGCYKGPDNFLWPLNNI